MLITRRTVATIFVVASQLGGGAAWAAAPGHGEPSIADLLPYWINFLAFVALLTFLLRSLVVRGWAARRDAIASAVAGGAEARATAEKELAAAGQRLAALPERIREVEQQVLREGELEARELIQRAEESAQLARTQAQVSIAAEQRAIERTVREQVAARVLNQVQERLQRELTPERDRVLREAVLGGVRSMVQ